MSPRYLQIFPLVLASITFAIQPASAGFFVPTNGPDAHDATDIAAAPNGDVYATRSNFYMFALRSGSEAWAPTVNPPGPFRQVQVGPDGAVWAFGWNPNFVSLDAGSSWQTGSVIPQIDQLEFDAAGRALARTASGLYRSDNHGASWTPLAFAGQNVGALAVDGATIWAAVGLVLQRSNDSGANWAPAAALPLPATALAAHPAGGVYAGLANGWGPCAPGGMYRVTDGGEVSPLGLVAHPIHAIRVQANGDVFASAGDACSYYMSCAGTCNSPGYPDCGVSGVYRSIDAGASWTRVTTQDGIPGKIVLRADGALCTAATGSWCDICNTVSPGVLMSSDAGASWVTRNKGLGRDRVSYLATSGNVVHAANNNTAYASVDHGVTWPLMDNMSPVTCAQFWGSSDLAGIGPVAFAYQDAVGVHRLVPGNPSLIPLPAGQSTGTLSDMVTTESGALVAATQTGVYVASTPLVSGFLPFGFGHPDLTRLAAGRASRVAGASSTKTYISENAGQNWTQIANVAGNLAFTTDGYTLYVVQPSSHSASLWRLSQFNNWQTTELVSTFPIASNFVSDVVVDAVGAVYVLEGARVIRLSPGATLWTELGTVPQATKMALASDGYLYLATEDGVWRSGGPVGSATDVGPANDVIAAVSVGPNPVSHQANIRFTLGQPGPVHLAVYDVRGRLVTTLLSKAEVEAGPHEVVWQPDGRVPSGVYLYRLQVGEAERTGRISLLRR